MEPGREVCEGVAVDSDELELELVLGEVDDDSEVEVGSELVDELIFFFDELVVMLSDSVVLVVVGSGFLEVVVGSGRREELVGLSSSSSSSS